MSDFTRQYSGFRFAPTRYGDSLQLIAYREMGDANAWAQLAWFNNLIAPFVTDDPLLASDRVLLGGRQIRIPTTVAQPQPSSTSADDVLLSDCQLLNRRLTVNPATGDFNLVCGRENLKQALIHRVVTDPGELMYHPAYGCKIQRRRGNKNAAVAILIGRMDVQDALAQETRLKRINSITPSSNGDVLAVTVDVTPITGNPIIAQASV